LLPVEAQHFGFSHHETSASSHRAAFSQALIAAPYEMTLAASFARGMAAKTASASAQRLPRMTGLNIGDK
jgi:hypothetical protein